MELFSKQLGQKSAAPTVILIHGFCEDHRIWEVLTPQLSEDCNLILVDLPGFGQSSTQLPLPLTIDWAAEELFRQAIEPLNTRPLLIGHSLGGYVSLSLIERYASAIEGICLFHSTAFADSEEKKNTRNKVIDFVNEKGVQEYVEQFVPGLFHSTFRRAHEDKIAQVVALAAQTPRLTVTAWLAAMRDRPGRNDVLKRYRGKKLVIAGEKDAAVPLEQSLALKELVGQENFVLLKDTAHMGMFERTPECVEAIRDFLRQ